MKVLDARTAAVALCLTLTAVAARGESRPAAAAQAKDAPQSTSGAADPLAQRLCDALHTLPAKRKGECCGTTPSNLAALCTQEVTAAMRSGAVSIDEASLEPCTTETARQLEGCSWVTPFLQKPPAVCTRILQGKLESGRACRSSLECLDGLYCRGLTVDRAGTCASPAPLHASCAAPADNLAAFAGLQGDRRHAECAGLCIKGACLPLAEKGAACPSSALCVAGLRCIDGHCQEPPQVKIGGECKNSVACAEGAYCEGGKCRATKRIGETCAMPVECGGLACERAQGAKTGTCADPCGPGGRLRTRAK